MANLSVRLDQLTFNENPQECNRNDSALDKVIDPSIDFQMQSAVPVSTTNEAYNLLKPKLFSLHTKDYKIDNELPRVHNTSSCQTMNIQRIKCKKSMSQSSLQSVSSMSDLGGFEDEYMQFKNFHLKRHFKQTDHTDVSYYETKIQELSTKLHESLVHNEKYKFNLEDLERKIELAWNEKYQDLMREKTLCGEQLDYFRSQFEIMKSKKDECTLHSNDMCSVDKYALESKLNTLEKQYNDINSKLILVTNESIQWHTEAMRFETENEKLRLLLQETNIKLDNKQTILTGLKNKITEQHIELQESIQANLKSNNKITSLNNEIEIVKKSEKWYIEQLHLCQAAKNKMQQELMLTQSNSMANIQRIETLQSELTRVNNLCEETRARAMREKEKLIRKVEMIEADMLEREAIMKCVRNEMSIDVTDTKRNETNEPQCAIIQECEERLAAQQKMFDEKQAYMEGLIKDNANYLVWITSLQKTLSEKELLYQSNLNTTRDLEQKCNLLTENSSIKDNELLESRNKVVNLEVALHAANRENLEIDEVVKNIREDFNKFMKQYNKLKEKLEEKSKTITMFEREKQELFMENNWRVCEIEELQRKVSQMEKSSFETNSNQHEESKTVLTKHVANLENEILKQNEILSAREEQLLNQFKRSEDFNIEISMKEVVIQELKQKLSITEEINKDLNRKLADANCVIEQFNNLCRNSEIERHDLIKQLEMIKTKDEQVCCKEDAETQTDCLENEYKKCSENIVISLNKLLPHELETTIANYNLCSLLYMIEDQLSRILNNQNILVNESENLQKRNKKLKTYIKLLKQKLLSKVQFIEERYNILWNKYFELEKLFALIQKHNVDTWTQTDADYKIQNKDSKIFMCSCEINERNKKLETSIHTLLGKVKEQMRARKLVEQKMESCKSTYDLAKDEANTLKILSTKNEIELETLRARCEEYKSMCEKLNGVILNLEKEKTHKSLHNNCLKCFNLEEIKRNFTQLSDSYEETQKQLKILEEAVHAKESAITEYKKKLFDEKMNVSTLRKQLSSLQMCLDNANQQLDRKHMEIAQIQSVCDKLEKNEHTLSAQLENTIILHHESKQKLEFATHQLDDTKAKDALLLDEIKTVSCHLHKTKLELSSVQNKLSLLESTNEENKDNQQKCLADLKKTLMDTQSELDSVSNDKFFMQRLCSDLKMTLQSTVNKNKVLEQYIQALVSGKLTSNVCSESKINEEHINRLLEQSTVLPDMPMKNLRICLDSLKQEMAILQKEILAKTQFDTSI